MSSEDTPAGPGPLEPPAALTPAPVTPATPSTWPTPAPTPTGAAGQPPGAPAEGSTSAPPFPTRTSGNAVAALILSILSWALCPVILAIIALVLASKADREVAASNGTVTSSGLSLTAKIVAWVNIGVSAAGIVIGVIVLLIALAAGGFGAVTQGV